MLDRYLNPYGTGANKLTTLAEAIALHTERMSTEVYSRVDYSALTATPTELYGPTVASITPRGTRINTGMKSRTYTATESGYVPNDISASLPAGGTWQYKIQFREEHKSGITYWSDPQRIYSGTVDFYLNGENTQHYVFSDKQHFITVPAAEYTEIILNITSAVDIAGTSHAITIYGVELATLYPLHDDALTSWEIVDEMDRYAATIPISEVTVIIDNSDGAYDTGTGTASKGLVPEQELTIMLTWFFDDGKEYYSPIGTYYIVRAESDSDRCIITAEDAIRYLAGTLGDTYVLRANHGIQAEVFDLLNKAGIKGYDGSIVFMNDSSKYVPLTKSVVYPIGSELRTVLADIISGYPNGQTVPGYDGDRIRVDRFGRLTLEGGASYSVPDDAIHDWPQRISEGEYNGLTLTWAYTDGTEDLYRNDFRKDPREPANPLVRSYQIGAGDTGPFSQYNGIVSRSYDAMRREVWKVELTDMIHTELRDMVLVHTRAGDSHAIEAEKVIRTFDGSAHVVIQGTLR